MTNGSFLTQEIMLTSSGGKVNVLMSEGYNPMPTFNGSFLELPTIGMLELD